MSKRAYSRFEGTDIWVTAEAPEHWDSASRKITPPEKYLASFKFHHEPGTVDGEYLRDSSQMIRWFDSADEAVSAAFEAAEARIREQKA